MSGLTKKLSIIFRPLQKPYLVSFIVIAIVCSLFSIKVTSFVKAEGCIPGPNGTCLVLPKVSPPKDTSKKVEDRCFLIAPGMSGINDHFIYGEKDIRAFNDKNIYRREEIDEDCKMELYKEDLPEITPLFSAVKPDDFPVTTKTFGGITCPVWAVDYEGNEAWNTESAVNYGIRQQEKKEYEAGNKTEQYSVTLIEDYDLLLKTAKMYIRSAGASNNENPCYHMSNEECIETTSYNSKNGKNARNAHGEGKGPTKEQHMEYWNVDEDGEIKGKANKYYTLPPPEGSDKIKMHPKFCPVAVDGKPTCTSADVDADDEALFDEIFVTGDYSLLDTGPNAADVYATESCEFKNSKATPSEVPNSNDNPLNPDDKKPDTPGKKDTGCPPGGCNPGSGNPGGGSPGGGGGGMDELLKQLMQALQGLGQGGGNNSGNGNSNSSATPTPTPYVCVTSSTDEKVCGVDGVTYASRCVAEYENEVSVRHTGVCTSSDIVSTSTDSTVSTLSALLQQLATSGMPSNTISSVTQAIVELIGRISIGDSAS